MRLSEKFKGTMAFQSGDCFDLVTLGKNCDVDSLNTARQILRDLQDEGVVSTHVDYVNGVKRTRYRRKSSDWAMRQWRNPIPEFDWLHFNPVMC